MSPIGTLCLASRHDTHPRAIRGLRDCDMQPNKVVDASPADKNRESLIDWWLRRCLVVGAADGLCSDRCSAGRDPEARPHISYEAPSSPSRSMILNASERDPGGKKPCQQRNPHRGGVKPHISLETSATTVS
ncbi:hypothetical protein TgHK011_003065 [Trichoderma gracile]|nr:hypothetical protein TgHK011_003065 [Trichoderma gracile]